MRASSPTPLPVSLMGMERTGAAESEASLVNPDEHSLLIFRLGRHWLALPTLAVAAVVTPVTPHRLPQRHTQQSNQRHNQRNNQQHPDDPQGEARHALLGIVQVRGRLLPCVSLAALLGIDDADTAPRRDAARMLLLAPQGVTVPMAARVSAVRGVERVHHAEATALLDDDKAPAWLAGILPVADTSVHCLDIDWLAQALVECLR